MRGWRIGWCRAVDAALHVLVTASVASPLGDRDPVNGGVDLSVAATVQSESLAGTPHRDRGGAVPTSERRP